MKRLVPQNKDYDYYLHWQKSKTSKPALREQLLKEFDKKSNLFYALFLNAKKYVPSGNVICLGARMGEEVQAFRDLGYNAIGVDLVPNEPLVIYGDFNNLAFKEKSQDIVYTNAIDHCWDMCKFGAEMKRVLKPGGLIVLHLCVGRSKEYESYHIDQADEVIEVFKDMELLESNEKFGINLHFAGLNHEVILRKK